MEGESFSELFTLGELNQRGGGGKWRGGKRGGRGSGGRKGGAVLNLIDETKINKITYNNSISGYLHV